MRRVFYYSSYGLKVYLWRDKSLLGEFKFSIDEEGIKEFEQYLESSPETSSQLLVDVMDEDFRRESIPHVNSRDRKALIQRLVDRHYRDQKYHKVQILGRSKEGRKDDNLLMSSLSNIEKINPFMEVFDRLEVPLAGIWSVPLLKSDLLKLAKFKDKNLLLVTRELPWSQRETFFRNGKMIFSRLERLDHNLYYDSDQNTSLDCLTKGAEQIHHFLTNQRIVGFGEKITVACFVPKEQKEICILGGIDTQQLQYKMVDESDFFKHFGEEDSKMLRSDAIFSWLCSQKSAFSDHYGEKEKKANFYRFTIEKSIRLASGLCALFLFTAASLLFLNSLEKRDEIKQTHESTDTLVKQYDREFGTIYNQLEDAELVKASVEHSGLIKIESEETPQKYFNELAKVYSSSIYRQITLNEIKWTKHSKENLSQILREITGNIPLDEDEGEEGYDEKEYDNEAPRLKNQGLIRLVGKLNTDALNYRKTVSIMKEFLHSLEQLPITKELHLLKTPVDIRPKAKFSDKSGIDEEQYTKSASDDLYEILIVIDHQSSFEA